MAYNVEQYEQQILTNGSPEVLEIAENSLQFGRHKISVSIFDAAGAAVLSGVTGSISLGIRGFGADQFETSSATLDLAAGERTFVPILDNIDQVRLEATGLTTGHHAVATIASSGSDL